MHFYQQFEADSHTCYLPRDLTATSSYNMAAEMETQEWRLKRDSEAAARRPTKDESKRRTASRSRQLAAKLATAGSSAKVAQKRSREGEAKGGWEKGKKTARKDKGEANNQKEEDR